MTLEFESKLRPVYPLDFQRFGISGKVRLAFNVHHDGSVSDVVVLKSDYREFANSVIYAASRWRFKPWDVSADKPAVVDVQTDVIFYGR
jgi:TonB family protein